MIKITEYKKIIISLYKYFLRSIYRKYITIVGSPTSLSRYLFRMIQAGLYLAILLLVLNFIGVIFGATAEFGSFGDFLGGTLNPIFTFLMLIGLIVTIILQKTELSLARKEFARTADALLSQDENLKYQRFENTFFRMLEFLDDYRSGILIFTGHIKGKFEGNNEHGRKALKSIYSDLLREFNVSLREELSSHISPNRSTDNILYVYREYYRDKHGELLNPYFKIINNILRTIEDSHSITDKQIYIDFFCANLSRHEYGLLFYHCLSCYGDSDDMAQLVQKMKILNYMDVNVLPKEDRNLVLQFGLMDFNPK